MCVNDPKLKNINMYRSRKFCQRGDNSIALYCSLEQLTLWFQRRSNKISFYESMTANVPGDFTNLDPRHTAGRVYV